MAIDPRETISYPRFFNPEELGKSLKEVATDLIATTHHDVVSRWFHSSKDADLFIWSDSNQRVIKQQLTFYGQVVEWNIVEGVRTGLVVEDDERGRERMGASEVVHFDPKPQAAPIEQAAALLKCITAIKEDERQTLIQNFRMSKMDTTMPPEIFNERFAAYLGKPKLQTEASGRNTGWLARLLAFFKGR